MELTPRWKLIAGGAALVGVTVGGVAGATGGTFGLNDQRPAIELVDPASSDDAGSMADDGSPESADSPNESVEESADSPFDSPDDAGFVDPSPESGDSPNESAEDSPAPAPAPAPAQAPAPAPAADSWDSPASANSASWDSPDSADSD